MSFRAFILGLMLALLVSLFTYFNDAVIQQTPFIGNFLPISVFGVLVVLALIFNPLLGKIRRTWALRSGELMLITALGLAACGWPGSGLYRTFNTSLALPADMVRNKTGWQAAGVMSYVPGASAMLADAHVRGIGPREADQYTQGISLGQALQDENAAPTVAVFWSRLSPDQQSLLARLSTSQRVQSDERAQAVEALNAVLADPAWLTSGSISPDALPDEAIRWLDACDARESELESVRVRLKEMLEAQAQGDESHTGRIDALRARARDLRDDASGSGLALHAAQMANRWALADALPNHVLPPPRGHGVLPNHGLAGPWVTDGMLVARPPQSRWPVDALPWRAWGSSLYRWGGLLTLMGLLATCLAVIVHPQWSKRELLPYPLVAFVAETVQTSTDNSEKPGLLPTIMSSRLFWIGVGMMALLHGVNGLHEWFNAVPVIKTTFDLTPARPAIPGAFEVPTVWGVFYPTLYPSVIAFTFFLTLSVGFSLSLSMFAWLLLGVLVIGSGSTFGQGFYDAKEGQLLRFGAYVGMIAMIIYTGRRYYASVMLAAMGVKVNREETPTASVWAGRALGVLGVSAVWWLHGAGMEWGWALLFLLLSLGTWLVMARIVAETGCFYVQPGFIPIGIIGALLGQEAMGPTGIILMGLASLMVIGDQREAVLPFIVHSLKLAERKNPKQETQTTEDQTENKASKSNRNKIIKPMPSLGTAGVVVGAVVVLSLVTAGFITMATQYRVGINNADRWGTQWFPEMAWNGLTHRVQDMAADGTLVAAAWGDWTQRWSLSLAEPGAWGWALAGLILLMVCATARLRLAWWPIHPILFLVWGSTPMERFAWSFVIGWLLKLACVKLAGANGYRAAKPLMIGVIAGELLAALVWSIVGVTYYLLTGTTPSSYIILPQ